MATKKKKSAWEEARDFLGSQANNLSSVATKTFNTASRSVGNFSNAFNRDYNNYNKQKEAQAQRNRQNLVNFTNSITNTARNFGSDVQKTKSNITRYLDSTQDVNPNKIGPQNIWADTPSLISNKIISGQKKFQEIPGVKPVTRLGTGLLTQSAEAANFLLPKVIQSYGTVGGVKIPILGNIADQTANFYGGQTQKVRDFTHKIGSDPYLAPSQNWQQSTLQQKFTSQLPETLSIIGPSTISSIIPYAINPALGASITFGSTADQVKSDATARGVSEQSAERLAVGTALLVAVLDRIVPAKAFGGQKQAFNQAFSRRLAGLVMDSSKESGTEITQETIQLLAEATFRDDLGFDEVQTRIALNGFGGLLGGTGMGSIANFADYNLKNQLTIPEVAGAATMPEPAYVPAQGPQYRAQTALDETGELSDAEAARKFGYELRQRGVEKRTNQFVEDLKREKEINDGLNTNMAPIQSDLVENPDNPRQLILDPAAQSPQYRVQNAGKVFDPNQVLTAELYTIFNQEYINAQNALDIEQDLIQNLPTNITGREALAKFDLPVAGVGQESAANVAERLRQAGYTSSEENPVEIIKDDIDKVVADVGNQIVDEGQVSTAPVMQDPFDADPKMVEAQIRSMLSDDDLEVLGVKQLFTEDGQPAWGKIDDTLIQLVEENGKVQSKTAYHEAMHRYIQKYANQDLYSAAVQEYVQGKSLSPEAATEQLADDFADFVAGRQTFTGQVQAFFNDLLVKLREFAGRVSSAELLFQQAFRGERGRGTETEPAYREMNTNLFGDIQNNLTTGVLQQLQGREVIPANEVVGLLNKQNVRGMEKFIVQNALNKVAVNGKVNVEALSREVKSNLFALQAKVLEDPAYGPDNGRHKVILQDAVRHPGAKYNEVIYDGGVKSFAGMQHFGGGKDNVENYFAHVRYDDWPDGTRAILEMQSDLMQSWLGSVLGGQTDDFGNSDTMLDMVADEIVINIAKKGDVTDKDIKEAINKYGLKSNSRYTINDMIKVLKLEQEEENVEYKDINEGRIELLTQLRDALPTTPATDEQVALEGYKDSITRSKRLIREEIVRAARDGQTRLLFPTGDTALRMEDSGLVENGILLNDGRLTTDKPLRDFASNPKFKRVYDIYQEDLPKALEQIGKKYETIMDERGVTWNAVSVSPEDANAQVPAFRKKAGRPNRPVAEDFPRRPGELNVNRLDTNKKRKKDIYESNKRKKAPRALTEEEVREYADRTGLDTKTLSFEEVKKMAAQHYNLRRRIVEVDNQIVDLKKKKGSRDEIIDLLNQRHELSNQAAAQARTEGQMLRMRRLLATELNTPMNTIFQSLDMLGIDPAVYTEKAADVDFNDPDQVIQFWRDVVPASFGMWFDKLRYNAMLSSPNTHLVNLASNLQGTGLIAPVDLALQGMIDATVSVLTGRERTRFAREGLEYARGFYGSQGKALKNGLKLLLKGDLTFKLQQDDGPIDMTQFNPLMVPLARKGGRIPFRLQKVVEKTLDVPSIFLAAEDTMSATAAQQGMTRALEYRRNKGIPVSNLSEEAKKKAQKTIFRGDLYDPNEGIVLRALGRVGEGLKSGANSDVKLIKWPVKMSIPFINIGTNLAKAGLESNPVTGAVNLFGNQDKTSSVSKMIMGGAFTLGAMALAEKGMLIGPEDEDKTKRDQGRAGGKIPWSVRVPTPWGEKYIQFYKMHPVIAFQLGMVAAIQYGLETGKISEDKAEGIQAAIASSLGFINDQTYWRNVGDFVNMLNGDEFALQQLIYNYPAQTIPYRAFLSWLNRGIDEFQRAPDPDATLFNSIMQRYATGIPGLSTLVPTRKDPYGADMRQDMPIINMFSPYKISSVVPDQDRIYGKMKVRADVNKRLKLAGDAKKEAMGSAELTTPEQKKAEKEKTLDKEINRGLLKLGVKGTETPEGTGADEAVQGVFQWVDPSNPDEVITLDLNKYGKKGVGMGKYTQQSDMYADARKIWEAPISQESKDKAFKMLGLDPDDVRYDVLANTTEKETTDYLVEKFSNMNHETMIERILTGRVESISGDVFITNSVLDNLADLGFISADEAKLLKNVVYDKVTGKLKMKSSGSGKKKDYSMNVDIPSIETVKLNLPGVKSGGGTSLSTALKDIPKAPKIKLPKIESPYAPGSETGGKLKLNLPQFQYAGAKTIGELGRA